MAMQFHLGGRDVPNIPVSEGQMRLVNRRQPKFEKLLATYVMITLTESGTFIMEQKMLRIVRDGAETVDDAVAAN